jgi:hypothetical protein
MSMPRLASMRAVQWSDPGRIWVSKTLFPPSAASVQSAKRLFDPVVSSWFSTAMDSRVGASAPGFRVHSRAHVALIWRRPAGVLPVSPK